MAVERRVLYWCAAALVLVSAISGAQVSLALRIRTLESQLASLESRLGRSKRNSSSDGPLSGIRVPIDGAAKKGSLSAALAIIEWSDFQCPFCGRFAKDVLPEIDRRYIHTGAIQYFFKNLPLERAHPMAFDAAIAAHCANKQGRFWPLHDAFFRNRTPFSRSSLDATLIATGVASAAVSKCRSIDGARAVRADIEEAQRLDITGTPTFFIGRMRDSGAVDALYRLSGAQPIERFVEILQGLHAEQAK